ncbi:MAG TPA: hypothetical protein VIS96_08920 [Terrimicrobiaceae bacterium]
MFFTRLYYHLKPFVPRRLRLALRRVHVSRVKRRSESVWPIHPGSERPPKGWQGWPEGKRFAFVLTHDVEGQRGLDRVKELAELDMEMGFRSSFNFVPEGSYSVPESLRTWLTDNGFEVGVHDLHHDGHLFASQECFLRKAQRINRYLEEWNAVGFRPAYMLRNLEWTQNLNIAYDSSTFDTDPFEPQPDGVGTIFPFWIPASSLNAQRSTLNSQPSTINGLGYVELPYTLTQDSTLFLLLEEKTNSIWKKKADWIAEHGGMVLLNTHPDYMRFNGRCDFLEFPATLYKDFLQYVKSRYANHFWHGLPRQVARFVSKKQSTLISRGKRLLESGERYSIGLLSTAVCCC